MNKLPSRTVADLPGTLEGLREYVLLSGEKVKAYKLVLKSANRQGAKEIYEQTLAEGQIVGESALHAEAKMGEMLERIPEKKASSGSGTRSLPHDIDKKSSHYAQQLARHPQEIEKAVATAKERGEIPTRKAVLGLIKHGIHYSSETPEHYTPKNILDAVVACMGAIDLDPCSNPGKANVPARTRYRPPDDGLSKTWRGRVFMNPPYGRDIPFWVCKLRDEYVEERTVTQAIALVPSRTDTEWFRVLRDYPVCFVRGRLTFVGNSGPAPFPSAVFYLGDGLGSFTSAFGSLGDIWTRIR